MRSNFTDSSSYNCSLDVHSSKDIVSTCCIPADVPTAAEGSQPVTSEETSPSADVDDDDEDTDTQYPSHEGITQDTLNTNKFEAANLGDNGNDVGNEETLERTRWQI